MNASTGAVQINGVDLRQPTHTAFSWAWGDGGTTQGWFPQNHTYGNVQINYTLQVTSHEDNGTTDCAQMTVPFAPQSLNGPLPTGIASRITIDPTSPSTIYASTDSGVFKTTNGGLNWTDTGLPNNKLFYGTIAIDPANSSVLYVSGNGGVYVSTNGGSTWTSHFFFCAPQLAVVPTTPTTIYAGSACDGGISKSTDNGQTWAAANAGLSNQSIFSLAFDPTNLATLYTGTANGVYKSIDGGQSWGASSSGLSGQIGVLLVDPVTPTNVWAASGATLYRSTNGGQSWTAIGSGLSGTIYAVIFDPFTHSTMYASTSAGFYKSTNGGQSWSASNSGLPAAFVDGVNGIAADRVNACLLYASTTLDTVYRSLNCGASWSARHLGMEGLIIYGLAASDSAVYAGTSGNGLYKSVNGGMDWTEPGYPSQNVASLTIDPGSPGTVYAAAGYKTTNGGQSWTSLGISANCITIDSSNASVLYAGGFGTVYKSTNGGQTWTAYSSGLPSGTTSGIATIAVDPGNSSNVYAGTATGSALYKSTDGGQHWAAANTGLSTTMVQFLAFDQHTPAKLYAATINGLYQSSNGAQSWSLAPGFPSYFSFLPGVLAFDPSDANIIYVGGSGGVWKSTDGGQTWAARISGLQYLYVKELAIDASHAGTVYAGTYGGGIFKSTNGGASWFAVGASPSQQITVTPAQGNNNGSATVLLGGSTILNGAAVKLTEGTLPDIAGSNLVNFTQSTLQATFNLNGAVSGARDVVITAADGTPTVLYNAFTITQAPPCTYSVSPASASVGSAAVSGNFVVTASAPQCTFTVSSNANWISAGPTLQPQCIVNGIPCSVPSYWYSVTANTAAAQRSGSISIIAQNSVQATFNITQAGQATCTYSTNSSGQSFGPGGGSVSVQVTAPTGCAWQVANAPGWLSFPSGTSSSGTGSVSIVVAANPGASRSASLIIAGRPFSITQAAASACGAVDESGSVNVSQGTFFLASPVNPIYNRKITLTNASADTIPAPIYLVLDGSPNYTLPGCQNGCGVTPQPPVTHCQAPTSTGSSLILFSTSPLAHGQSVSQTISFQGTFINSIGNYTTRVLSGKPNQ